MSSFTVAPAPWKCKADIYWLFLSLKTPLVEDAYAPLEASSETFAHQSKYKAGLAGIQVIRYSDTPVGPYDEIFFIPGAFEVPPSSKGEKRPDNLKITRIYVNQKDTTWNGRKNWGIPKHLARFEFETLTKPDRIKVQLFSPDVSIKIPFFSATMQPFTWAPSFPFSTKWAAALGENLHLTQPPLPAGDTPELVGTTDWFRYLSVITCSQTKLCWINVDETDKKAGEGVEGWFPAVKPFKVGLFLRDATIDVGEAEILDV